LCICDRFVAITAITKYFSQVDTIDPVAGVTVLEGGRTRQGPRVLMVSIFTKVTRDCIVQEISL